MLGHLHHPFSIEDDKIKYSGSLLQYSFSEAGQAKGYRRVTINDGIINDLFIPLKPLRQWKLSQANIMMLLMKSSCEK